MPSAESHSPKWTNESGAVLVEVTVTILLFLTVLFGIVEFSYAYYQWNAATKATEFGARIASVSDPVRVGLRSWTGTNLTGSCAGLQPGDPIPVACGYDWTCNATNASGSTGTCPASNDYSSAAMQAIIFGRDSAGAARTTCDFSTANLPQIRMGMCNFFTRLNGNANRVQIRYQYTKLGYAGRPGGPVPTVTVRLNQMPFQFVLLSFMFGTVTMPDFATTITGEDLNPAAPT